MHHIGSIDELRGSTLVRLDVLDVIGAARLVWRVGQFPGDKPVPFLHHAARDQVGAEILTALITPLLGLEAAQGNADRITQRRAAVLDPPITTNTAHQIHVAGLVGVTRQP